MAKPRLYLQVVIVYDAPEKNPPIRKEIFTSYKIGDPNDIYDKKLQDQLQHSLGVAQVWAETGERHEHD